MEFKLQRVSYYLYPVSFFISNVTCQESPCYIQSHDSKPLQTGKSWILGLLDQESPALPSSGPLCDGIQDTLLPGLCEAFPGSHLTHLPPTDSHCMLKLHIIVTLAQTPPQSSSAPSRTPSHPEAKAHLRGRSPSQGTARLLPSQNKAWKNT